MTPPIIDVTFFNAIENSFLKIIISVFGSFSNQAQHLIYYFLSFEIILFGLGWAFSQQQTMSRMIGQLLKIGLILFIVNDYNVIADGLLKSSVSLSNSASQGDIQQVLLNPGVVWEYGYDFAVGLLKEASSHDGFAIPLILISLGFGILLVVGILGIQILMEVLGFYFIAAASLLIIPFSVFTPMTDFFARSLQGLLQSMLRLITISMIAAIALLTWKPLNLLAWSSNMSINVPLGFFFTGLLFVVAAHALPRRVAKLVGLIRFNNAPAIHLESIAYAQASGQTQAAAPSSKVEVATSVQQSRAAESASMQHIQQSGSPDRSPQHRSQDIARIKKAFYEVIKEKDFTR